MEGWIEAADPVPLVSWFEPNCLANPVIMVVAPSVVGVSPRPGVTGENPGRLAG